MSNLGQLIMSGIGGVALLEEEKKFITDENIGGIILFKKNYESPAQLAELINSIQILRQEFPLFIAIDHEGGRVNRLKTGFTQIPSAYDLSLLNSPKACFEVYQIMAKELKACGINLNLAPVCDILSIESSDCIGDRAFGRDAESVGKLVTSAIRGLQTNGVMACAKHFPGHGATTKDSHLDLPIIKTPLETLKNREFQPFIKAIKARVDFVMMAHLMVDALDNDFPSSLSAKTHQLLRKELKFNKIIISDDMQMGAIADHFGAADAAVSAISAGSDVIEYRDFVPAVEGLEALKKAVKDKILKADDLNKKYERVKLIKQEYLKDYNNVYIPSLSKSVNTAAHQQLINELSSKITELKKT